FSRDWSSDVCSSDLPFGRSQRRPVLFQQRHYGLAVEAGAALAPALQPEIRIHRALLSGMRDGTPPPRYMLATARGAPPRAAALGYDVLFDVEAIDLLPRPCITGLRRGLARRRALRHRATTSCSTSAPSTFCRAAA